ncbi:MAG: SurA N-terminal domain-containing protein, partial [Pseudomonadota bacterium]
MRKLSVISTSIIALALAAAPLSIEGDTGSPLAVSAAHASEIKVVVNDEVVTSYAIARRTAFLKLQRRKGNLRSIATEELTEEALKRDAIRRAGFRIPESQVDSAFANFARSNKLSPSQLRDILGQAGVTTAHFKDFIRVQIGWSQTLRARSQGQNQLMSEQDVVAKMLENGGQKPTSTEYLLHQVIFVVPENKRGSQ